MYWLFRNYADRNELDRGRNATTKKQMQSINFLITDTKDHKQ